MARINTGPGGGSGVSSGSSAQEEEEESTSSGSSSSQQSSNRRGRDGTNQTRESVTGTTSPTGGDVGTETPDPTGESTTVDRDRDSSSSTESQSQQSSNRRGRDGTNQTRESVSGTTSPVGGDVGTGAAETTGESLSQSEVEESLPEDDKAASSVQRSTNRGQSVSASGPSTLGSGGPPGGVVGQVEDAAGFNVPSGSEAIEQGEEFVASGASKVTDTGDDILATVTGRRKRREFRGDPQGPFESPGTGVKVSGAPQGTVAQGAVEKDMVGGRRRDFGPEAEPENVIEDRIPEEGDLLEGTSPAVRDFGRTVLGEEAPDAEITNSLREGDGSAPFTLTDEERQGVNEDIRHRQDYFGVGEEAEEVAKDLTGSDKAASVAKGVGDLPGTATTVPAAATLLTDDAIRTAANFQSTAEEQGVGDTGEAIANSVFSSARGEVERFSENPYEMGGEIAGGFVAGAAITRGATAARTSARSARVRSRADSEVDLEDITSEKGVRGENPTFKTDTDAPTSEAVDELSTRAADNPKAAAPGDADSAVFHTTGSDISGSRGIRNRVENAMDKATPGGRTPDIDVGEGRSELPGLFTSPDASPLGLDMGTRSSIATSLGRPRLRGGKSDQVVSLPGDDIRGMPESAQGAGYELRAPDGSVKEQGLGRGQAKSRAEGSDLEVRPDSSTEGYQFLKEDAEAGAIYARPSGSRTPELEGIAPPGSKFVEEGITAVNMPGRSISLPGGRELGIPGTGRTIPMRRFERMDSDEAGGKSSVDLDDDAGDVDAEAVTAYELPSSQSRSVTPGQQAAAGGYLGGGTSAVSGGGKAGTSSDSNALSETTSPTDIDSSKGASGSRGRTGTGLGIGSSTGLGSGSGGSGSPTSGSGGPTGSGRSTGGTSSSPPTTGGSSSSPGGSSSGVPTSLIDTPTSPPTRPHLPDFDSNSQKKRRSRDIESFERTFEFNVADPDDVLEGTLSVDTGGDVAELTDL